jgi:DNA-binding transcriptional ArsR family regulator/uncharacterized protein YndB with AHSA1/START domain
MSADGPDLNEEPDLWRALASPWRRRLLDLLRPGPRTTGELADAVPELSRFAVMQHLDVLTAAGVVLVERRGRHRLNYLNAVPLRDWYERWVAPVADASAADLLALRRAVQRPTRLEETMSTDTDPTHAPAETVRTIRIANELRFATTAERLFKALTDDSLSWFPHTYGGDRVRRIVFEPRVGGAHYEDWGDGAGHLYAHITAYDPPHRYASRGRIMPGTILDAEYTITADGDGVVLRLTKVIVGPMTAEEAASVYRYGDLTHFEDALRAVVEQ